MQKNISNYIQFLPFVGPLLNTRQPQINGQQNSQNFLDIIYTDRFLQVLVFYENS